MKSTTKTRLLLIFTLLVIGFGLWSCRHSQDFSKTVQRNLTVHDKGSLDSRLMYVNFDEKLVQALILTGEKRDIVFEAEDEFLDFLRLPNGKAKIGWLLPVNFVCGKKPDEECNLNKPYVLYVATRKVKPVIVRKNLQSNP